MNDECRVQIGDICLSIQSGVPKFIPYFRHYYRNYLSKNDPDLCVEVMEIVDNVEESNIPEDILEWNSLETKVVSGITFSLYNGLIKGAYHKREKHCQVILEKIVFGDSHLPLFERFIFRDLYYVILEQKKFNAQPPTFFIHGCGILRKGNGYLFTGPSGCGKTTVAQLSKGDVILHDEILIVNKNGIDYELASTPYLSQIEEIRNIATKLKAALFLKHGKRTFLKRLSKIEATSRIVKQIVLPLPLLSFNRKTAFSEMLSFSGQLAEHIPFYELSFLPKPNFWELIDSL